MTDMNHWLPGSILPTLVAALAAWMLGALWYSPVLFAKQWMAANNISMDDVAKMQKDAPRAYGISFVCMVVMAHVMAWMIHLTGASTWMYGLHLAAMIWFGFALTLGTIAHVYHKNRTWAALWIDLGYQLVYMLIMGAIIGAWQ